MMNIDVNIKNTIKYLKTKKKILLITTSNRWDKGGDVPKSSQLALKIQEETGAILIDASKLNIFPCEGNVSDSKGNHCGVKDALMKNKSKNTSGNLRCWASLNNTSDELYKISNELFDVEVVVFFGSIRWGKPNAIYSKLIERLTWIENRHTTLGEKNIVKNIEAGIILLGHNFNTNDALKTEVENLNFFGFKVNNNLCWHYQYSKDCNEESLKSYKDDNRTFLQYLHQIKENVIIKFKDFLQY